MYKQKRNPFTANCCETSINRTNAPVVKVDMEDGVLGKANDDGTIHINKDVTDPKKIQEIVKHEEVHINQMKRGDLAYDDNNVFWKGKKYSRASMKEGAKNLPWEKEAYEESNSPLAMNSPLRNGKPKPRYKLNTVKVKKHRLKKLGNAIGDTTRNIIDKVKAKKSTDRVVSSTLENQENQIAKIEETTDKNTIKATTDNNSIKTVIKPEETKVLPTKVITPPPPPESFFGEETSYSYDPVTGRRTYDGLTRVGNVLTGIESNDLKGQPVTSQNYYDNALTKTYGSTDTNLTKLSNALWDSYKNTGLYNSEQTFKRDLKRDIAEYREGRDVASKMYDFTSDLPFAEGSTNIKQFIDPRTRGEDGENKIYQVKWQEAKDGVPGQYKFATQDEYGNFSSFVSLDDPGTDRGIKTAVSNARVEGYERKWKESKENQDFINKWGGSRNPGLTGNFESKDGIGVNFNPNMQNWYTSGEDYGRGFEGRVFQSDVNPESIGDGVGPTATNPYNDKGVLTGRYRQYE